MSLLPKRRIKNPATPQEIATTNRNAAIIGTGLSLLIPGGFFAGIGRKAIGQAFKKAGTSGLNLKSADTVGNRIKQAQAIMGLSKNKISLLSGAKVKSFKSAPYWLERGAKLGQGGGKTSIFAMGKRARTIQKAVEQGPAKFFSKGRHPKTGITAGKRTLSKFDRTTRRRERNYDEALAGANDWSGLRVHDYDEIMFQKQEDRLSRSIRRKSLLKRLSKLKKK